MESYISNSMAAMNLSADPEPEAHQGPIAGSTYTGHITSVSTTPPTISIRPEDGSATVKAIITQNQLENFLKVLSRGPAKVSYVLQESMQGYYAEEVHLTSVKKKTQRKPEVQSDGKVAQSKGTGGQIG